LSPEFEKIQRNSKINFNILVPALKFNGFKSKWEKVFERVKVYKDKIKIMMRAGKIANNPLNKIWVIGERTAKQFAAISQHATLLIFNEDVLKTMTLNDFQSPEFFSGWEKSKSLSNFQQNIIIRVYYTIRKWLLEPTILWNSS
jgi:hypothetical protein